MPNYPTSKPKELLLLCRIFKWQEGQVWYSQSILAEAGAVSATVVPIDLWTKFGVAYCLPDCWFDDTYTLRLKPKVDLAHSCYFSTIFAHNMFFFHKRFYSKNTREQNETHIFYLGNVNTAVVRSLIQEIDLTSYNDEGSLLCVVYRGLVSHQTEVKFIFQVWFDFDLNPFDNHLFICISLQSQTLEKLFPLHIIAWEAFFIYI